MGAGTTCAPHGAVFATFPAPPASKDLLFYIQRNKNANTIVYEANRDATGKLVSDDPVKVNWIRHTERGHPGAAEPDGAHHRLRCFAPPHHGRHGHHEVRGER
ncbi:MAG: DUF4833 domain-containing protein, partial [Flavobacteriales bacterium]|nr:DUF4833 domain-containing protein [Flavobacteriales bacterium]